MIVSTELLEKYPYINAITYPRVSLRSARRKIAQMRKIGIDGIVFEGKTKVCGLNVLGVGTVSVVLKAVSEGKEYALKVRREDSNRESMENEFKITSFVNKIGIGPSVFSYTKDLLLMEIIQGESISDWISSLSGKGMARRLREFIHSLLNQCRKLDILDLDHGELSNLRKHVIVVKDKPVIIDFESASFNRRPRNVTSAAQYLFVGSSISSKVRRILGIKDTGELIKILKRYKENKDDFSYSLLIEKFAS